MSASDQLTLVGVAVTAIGSSLGMFGILLQTNGYYAFKWLELFEHLYRVLRTLLRSGPAAASLQMHASVRLAEKKGENRVKSLIGLYCVLFGFFLQCIGSLLLIWAVFASKSG